ncbi:PKD domain-containing protein [Ferruginibacter sp. HRS2-29]|uniref:PKD domain-containing protein n=1 Tax=Ferruginibacter sp. HRS2-29 TaxID=2487334 RepID=UPI0020CDD144|nr:PKD domain-containing protein [Ferruginibacter sp. HRS2-29]MCP9753414.1 PKD domain-containing protein [Ferruginibacter sp. HRS2-29]
MRKYLLLVTSLFIIEAAFAQDFSNKGKDFYLCFPQHVANSTQNLAVLSIYITSDKASSGTITMANGQFSATFNIAANGIQEIRIPFNVNIHISNSESNTVIKKSIRIQTDPGKPAVVAYAQQWAGARSAATLLLPVNVLGKKYYATAFNQSGADFSTYSSRSQFQIIAVKNNTTVNITPRKNGVLEPTFTITLPLAGDMYQYQSTDANAATQDITGTLIESVASGAGACLPIAVFSGSSNITIGANAGCVAGQSSYDPLFQQLYPASTWGKNFGFIPFDDYPGGNPYRIMASENNTQVNINGLPTVVLNAGEIYPAEYTLTPKLLSVPTSITANKPICVTQYMQRNGCSGRPVTSTLGDPDMVVLNPIEQNISDINIFSSTNQAITKQVVNVLIKTNATASFKINGVAPSAAWQTFTNLSGYSYLRQTLSGSSARLTADSGFNAIAYGMGANESYAYSAGTNVKDLYQQIGVSSLYGIETTPSVCTGSPFKFKISLPYQPDSMYWDLSPQHTPVWLKRVAPAVLAFDSTTNLNGKQLWWYSLPLLYTYNTIGEYPITITTYNSNSDGCGSQQEIDFELEVSDPPVAGFTWVAPRCVAETVQFNDASTTVKPTYHWWWDFNDPASGAANNTSNLKNPAHKFTTPGTYRVRYSNITTPGCLSDTLFHDVVVPAMPTATITGNTSVCQNAPSPNITFTGAGGSAPYTFSYRINGGAVQTITTVTGNSITVAVPTTTPGSYIYTLTNIQNTGSTLCTQAQTGIATVLVRPLPTATIAGTIAVCQTGTSPNVTFTGAGATAPYTFTYTINGGAPLTVTTVTGNSVNVPAPTNTVGVFTYTLTNVEDASSNTCSRAITGASAVITIRQLPTATISGTTAACQNGAAPNITFTGTGGVTPYTFTYNINGGANQLITSTGNSVTVPVPTAATGTFTYTLTSVRDASPNICTNAVAGATAVVTIRPLPTATIAGTTSVCESSTSPAITFTGAGTTNPYKFTYTINGGAPQTVTSTGNVATVNVPTNVPGTFVYNLTSVEDATSTLCSRTITGASSTVIVRPLPTATITGATTVCLNSTAPIITLTGATGTAPYRFTYTINGGAPITLVSGAGGAVTVPVPTNTAGTFVYALTSVTDASSNTCSRINLTTSASVVVKPLPTATITTSSSELCLNAAAPNIIFTGAGGAPPYRFTYKINGGPDLFVTTSNTSSSVNVPVPTATAGTFNYTLVNVREGSASLCASAATGSASVLVNPLPSPGFTYTVPSCDTRRISFNSSTSVANAGTITAWRWSFGDAASGAANNTSTAPNPDHVFSGAGTFTVTLTITTNKGCVSAVFPRQVIITPRPKAGFVVPEVCLNDPFALLTDTSKIAAPGSITAWEWNFGDAANSTPGNPNTSTQKDGRHKYTAVGDYTVRLIAISNSGCRDTTESILTINGGNPVSNFIPVATNRYCGNDTIRIQNKSTIASGKITRLEIFWDDVAAPTVFEADETATPDSIFKHKYPEFQSPATKQYVIRVRAYSGATCFSDSRRTIVLNATPEVAFAAIPNGCIDVPPYRITQATETGGVAGTGVYSGPGIIAVSPGVYNFSPALAGQGTHTIKYVYTSTAGGCVDSASQQVTVYPNPVVNAGPDLTILEGGSITIQPTVTGNDLRYLWTVNQYLNNNTLKNPLASPPVDFTYTLTVTARGGCTASDQVFIKVLMAPKIPNTITPNNDGKHDTWKIEYLDTYPNCRVKVFTRTGKLVFESIGYKKPWDGNMNGKSLPVDTYYYIIEPESGRAPITGYVQIIK